MHNISIIIPTLNEAEHIERLLAHLFANCSINNIAEMMVVDGGSIDGTQDLVTQFQKTKSDCVILLNAPKGRAKQMNFAAKQATGSVLYFLHADSFPPKNFDAHIIAAVEKGNLAGCFRMQFTNTHWWLRLASWLTQFSWRACRGGDQSQFVTKKLFNALKGFDERYVIYEDNDFINKLYAQKQFVVINKKLHTSARLYERVGIWKLQYHFWSIYVKKWFGASAEDLHAYYLKNING